MYAQVVLFRWCQGARSYSVLLLVRGGVRVSDRTLLQDNFLACALAKGPFFCSFFVPFCSFYSVLCGGGDETKS